MAIEREQERLEQVKQSRKRSWLVILRNHSILRDECHAKFKLMVEARDWQLDIIRVTRKIVAALKRIVRHRGKNFPERTLHTIRHSFASCAMQFKDNYEERAKDKIRHFLEASLNLGRLQGAFLSYRAKVEYLQGRARHNKKVRDQHKNLLKKYFDREKARMIMTKVPSNAKDKELQAKLQELVQGIQQRLPDSIRDRVIDEYYKTVRDAFVERYKSWMRSMTA